MHREDVVVSALVDGVDEAVAGFLGGEVVASRLEVEEVLEGGSLAVEDDRSTHCILVDICLGVWGSLGMRFYLPLIAVRISIKKRSLILVLHCVLCIYILGPLNMRLTSGNV